MTKTRRSIPPFESGDSLFIFEGDSLRIFSEGTEAAVPLEDLRALLDDLAARPPRPSSKKGKT